MTTTTQSTCRTTLGCIALALLSLLALAALIALGTVKPACIANPAFYLQGTALDCAVRS